MEKEAIVARNEDTWPHYSKKKAILALPILMEACPVMVQLHINIFSKRKKEHININALIFMSLMILVSSVRSLQPV
jgi:hypothetical protein